MNENTRSFGVLNVIFFVDNNTNKKWYLINTTDHKHPKLFRSEEQFVRDLRNSGELKHDDSEVSLKLLRNLAGSVVSGDMTPYKKGETYLLSEFSSEVTKGDAKVGDERTYKDDGIRTEGFNNFALNPVIIMQRDQQEIIGKQMAEMMAVSMGLSIGGGQQANTNNAPALIPPADDTDAPADDKTADEATSKVKKDKVAEEA